MPVPEGVISTSTGPSVEEAIETIKEEDAELLERLEDDTED